MREAKNGGGGGICKRFFFCFLFWRERVVILKQGGSVMLNLPHACFLLLAFSLSSPLAFILYFYPNHHFTPNHRTCLGSPPTPQTKLRIPCYPLSSKNQCKRFPATSRPLLDCFPFSLHHYLYSFLYQLSCPKRATPCLKITTPQKPNANPPLQKKRRIPLPSQFSYHLNPTSPPFLLLSLFSLLKSIAHAYPSHPSITPTPRASTSTPKNTP